jgi:hypothetical protein
LWIYVVLTALIGKDNAAERATGPSIPDLQLTRTLNLRGLYSSNRELIMLGPCGEVLAKKWHLKNMILTTLGKFFEG